MANRVTDPEVKPLVPGTSITDLTPFIDAANKLVNKVAASPCGSSLSSDELKEIEKWLSAHFATVSDPSLGIVSQTVKGSSASASRGNVNSMDGVMSTQFGQMANSLSGGCLYEVTKLKPTVTFF